MNVLQIKIHEDGALECSPDFKIIRGSYRNILMNVEVPHSLLLDPVNDQTTNQAVTGNFVRVAAIIRTIVGKNLQTQKYDFEAVKDYERDGKMYRLYQRIMPKEFTLWATVNQSEAVGNGYLQLIFNVVNWTKSDAETPPLQNVNIEQIVASPILRLDVYAGAFIEDIEAIENPRNYDELKERVDYIEVDLTKVNNDIKDLQEKEVAVPNGNYPDMSVGNATNAQIAQTAVHSQTSDNAQIAINDSRGDNIAEHFEDIENLIPTDATVDNKLADKAFVNSTVNNMSAFYITVNQQGDAFPTYASLINATVFYNGGKERIPTQNDYATVLADETKPNGVDGSYPTTRYFYQTDVVGGTYPNGQWEFQYVVNNTTLTQAQVNAINSGITAAKLANIDTNINKKVDKSQIVQAAGESETALMSQSAVSRALQTLDDRITDIGNKDTSILHIFNAGIPLINIDNNRGPLYVANLGFIHKIKMETGLYMLTLDIVSKYQDPNFQIMCTPIYFNRNNNFFKYKAIFNFIAKDLETQNDSVLSLVMNINSNNGSSEYDKVESIKYKYSIATNSEGNIVTGNGSARLNLYKIF